MSEPNKKDAAFGDGDIMFWYSVVLFIAWQQLINHPLSPVLASVLPIPEAVTHFFVGVVLFGGFIYWLWFSKTGPGLNGVHAFLRMLLSPIFRIPDHIRFKALVPVLAVSVFSMLFTIGWLALSDEASYKRDLYSSWDRQSDIQWVYGEDGIDLYVYSETLDTIYGKHVPEDGDSPRAGVHVRYSSELLGTIDSDFGKTLKSDISHAQIGNLSGLLGRGEIGVYETKMNPYSFIRYHGVFGITGHGFLEIILMTTALMMGLIFFFTTPKVKSHQLLIAVAACTVFSLPPVAMTLDTAKPAQMLLLEQKNL